MANTVKLAKKSSYLANDRHRNLFYQLLKAAVSNTEGKSCKSLRQEVPKVF